MVRTLIAIVLGLPWPAIACAIDFEHARLDNWHQWRGPSANGVAPHADPPLHWDDATNIRWKSDIPGTGSATPIVWGDRIFVLTAVDTGQESQAARSAKDGVAADVDTPRRRGGKRGGNKPPLTTPRPSTRYQFNVLCLDRASGQLRWQRTATEQVPHEGHHTSHGYASASPTTDGQRLYVSFGSRGLFCYDLDGNLVWHRDLGEMQTRREFGEGASPVVHRGVLIVNWDHEGESFVTCLDAATGDDRWRVPRDEKTTWTTPLVVEHHGTTQVVVNGSNRTRSYDIATGDVLWQCGGQVSNPIPSPVADGGIVYCMSGFLGYAVSAIPLDARGDITDLGREVWRATDAASYVASPVLVDDLLYFTKSESGILCCRDASTGEPQYGIKRLPQIETVYSSPVAAANRLYITDRNGTTVVIRIGPEFEILATNHLRDTVDATLVPVGKQLLIRGRSTLYCIGPEG